MLVSEMVEKLTHYMQCVGDDELEIIHEDEGVCLELSCLRMEFTQFGYDFRAKKMTYVRGCRVEFKTRHAE